MSENGDESDVGLTLNTTADRDNEAANSFPKDFGYAVYDCDPGQDSSGALLGGSEVKPRILLMGLRRSGKSSIQKVVFHKMSPNETLFLESTNKVVKEDIANSSFVQFHIWDFPGQIDFFDPAFDSDMIFGGCGALIFVIDAQDDYMEALERLHTTVTRAYKVNPRINFDVFIHKVDGLQEDYKMETQRDIHQRANGDLQDSGCTHIELVSSVTVKFFFRQTEEIYRVMLIPFNGNKRFLREWFLSYRKKTWLQKKKVPCFDHVHLSFHLTSIYDHSIFEAFSKVVQKLIPQLPTLENLLNIFISNSLIEKAFLFDVVSKIYIATDSSPVDMQSYELCCDMIDVVIDVSCIYGLTSGDDISPAFDHHSQATIRLNNGTVLHLREVNRFLALVCILRDDAMEKQGMIDFNFAMFRAGIQKVFDVRKRRSAAVFRNDSGRELKHPQESP